MVGIYMEAAVALHGLTARPEVKAALQAQITKHCEHLMRDAYVVAQTPGLTSIPRVLLYSTRGISSSTRPRATGT